MTIEERKRIAIAKACGWKEYDHYPTGLLGRSERKWKSPAKGCLGQIDAPPDYLNDLNAMHEAEKVLYSNLNQWFYYCCLLEQYTHKSLLGDHICVHATAAQKADAFIKALNLEY